MGRSQPSLKTEVLPERRTFSFDVYFYKNRFVGEQATHAQIRCKGKVGTSNRILKP